MTITSDGNLGDWPTGDRLEKVGTAVSGWEIFGRFEEEKDVFAVKGTATIGTNSTFWLNTDRDSATVVVLTSALQRQEELFLRF